MTFARPRELQAGDTCAWEFDVETGTGADVWKWKPLADTQELKNGNGKGTQRKGRQEGEGKRK